MNWLKPVVPWGFEGVAVLERHQNAYQFIVDSGLIHY